MAIEVELPDGSIAEFPDGTDKSVIQSALQKRFARKDQGVVEAGGQRYGRATPIEEQPGPDLAHRIAQGFQDFAGGTARGAGSIGATALTPIDLATGATESIGNPERRQAMDAALQSMGVDTESIPFGAGKIGTEIMGTLPVGGILGKLASRVSPTAGAAISSGGFRLGESATNSALANALLRAGGGAATGGISAGMLNPEDADVGAMLGGGLPLATRAAGSLGRALVPEVSPEVSALYTRAKELGIDIPIDRIVNSRPLNALAASLNYVPLSGRAATEEKLLSQVNKAASRTIGQDSSNITQAVRDARKALGGEFDRVLKENKIVADPKLLSDLDESLAIAKSELTKDQAAIIKKQIVELREKIKSSKFGIIDGQTAYNIKRNLDRIATRSTPEGFYAKRVRDNIMDALDRSLGPEEAAAFAQTRRQWGNMRDLERLAPAGAEGEITAAKLANMRSNREELRDVADIAAQFVKSRESPHGAAQRIAMMLMGGGAAASGGAAIAPYLAGGMAVGRGANELLKSQALAELLTNPSTNERVSQLLSSPLMRSVPAVISANP